MMTAEVLVRRYPDAADYARLLLARAPACGIDTPLRLAHWLAQLAVESANFRRTRENLNYSVDGLLKTFGRHRISEVDARRLGRTPTRPADQAGIATCVYGGPWGLRQLGNTEPEDAARFIGRGLKQLTGRSNYAACSRGVYGDTRLLSHPELLEQPVGAVESALWFWTRNDLNALADADDLEAVTRRVNGGLNGLDARARALADLRRLCGA